ncbi:hypothetical protein [Halorussus halobius]|uniref:hypothetical protein n=1 Tax=Halorussus halobius TaxID=1710537 RepID=UPI001092AD0D|nr:hypothetical protein [Halorussus halobius]
MRSRRSVLAGSVAGLFGGGAGCLGALDSPPDPILRDVTVRNADDQPHAVAFALDREGERVHDATYELAARDFEGDGSDHLAGVDDAWDSPRGAFRAAVRVDGGPRTAFRLDDGVSPGTPYRYEVRILDGGEVSTWVSELGTTTA